jgi:hypothetical protein
MTSNAARFKIELEDEFDHIMEEVLPLVLQKIAMETLSRVVLRSPVDTGRFRGNWTVSVGGPSDETLDVFDKSGGPTIARGSAAVTGWRVCRLCGYRTISHMPIASRTAGPSRHPPEWLPSRWPRSRPCLRGWNES